MQESTLFIFATYMLRAFLPLFWGVFLCFYRKRTRQNIALSCIFIVIGTLYLYNSFARQPALAPCDVYNVRSYLILVFIAPFTIFYAHFALGKKIRKRQYLFHFIPLAVTSGLYLWLRGASLPPVPFCYDFNQLLGYASDYPFYVGYFLLLMTVFAAQVFTYFSVALAGLWRMRKLFCRHQVSTAAVDRLLAMDFLFLYYPLFCMVFMAYNNCLTLNVIHNISIGISVTCIAVLGMNLDLPLKMEAEATKRSVIADACDWALMNEIESLMINEKIYTDAMLSVETLAGQIGAKKHLVSKAINGCAQKKFTDYVNEYRVREAMRLLNEKKYDKFSIDVIAAKAGFNDRKSLYRVFKKSTGLSTTDFLVRSKRNAHL